MAFDYFCGNTQPSSEWCPRFSFQYFISNFFFFFFFFLKLLRIPELTGNSVSGGLTYKQDLHFCFHFTWHGNNIKICNHCIVWQQPIRKVTHQNLAETVCTPCGCWNLGRGGGVGCKGRLWGLGVVSLWTARVSVLQRLKWLRLCVLAQCPSCHIQSRVMCPDCVKRKVIFNTDDPNESNTYVAWVIKKKLGGGILEPYWLCNANPSVPKSWQLDKAYIECSPPRMSRFPGWHFLGAVTSSVPCQDSNGSELEAAYKLDCFTQACLAPFFAAH